MQLSYFAKLALQSATVLLAASMLGCSANQPDSEVSVEPQASGSAATANSPSGADAKQPQHSATTNNSESDHVSADGPKAATSFTAENFAKTYNQGPLKFIRKYQGKTLEVTGTVQGYGYHSIDDFGYLLIDGHKFEFQHTKAIAKALPGQLATFHGKCGEFGVMSWEIVKATGDPPPTFTVSQIIAEIEQDADAFDEKFSSEYLIINGEIVELDDEGSAVYMTPKGSEPEIFCRFSIERKKDRERNRGFEIGQNLRILAEMISPTHYLCEDLPIEQKQTTE